MKPLKRLRNSPVFVWTDEETLRPPGGLERGGPAGESATWKHRRLGKTNGSGCWCGWFMALRRDETVTVLFRLVKVKVVIQEASETVWSPELGDVHFHSDTQSVMSKPKTSSAFRGDDICSQLTAQLPWLHLWKSLPGWSSDILSSRIIFKINYCCNSM